MAGQVVRWLDMALTALEIKNAKPGMHADGGGLYLHVGKAGNTSWIFRFQLNKRRREMGLERFLSVSILRMVCALPDRLRLSSAVVSSRGQPSAYLGK